MPLLYGEGQNAFLRLQLETIQKISDITFLAWQRILLQPSMVNDILPVVLKTGNRPIRLREALATEPEAFFFSSAIYKTETLFSGPESVSAHWRTDDPINLRVNNLGLSLSLPLVKTLDPFVSDAVLPFNQHNRRLWMTLHKIGPLGRVWKRVYFPQITFSVPDEGCAAREEEVTLSLDFQTRSHQTPLMQYPKLYDLGGRRSPLNILLAFPTGLQGYQLLRRFPPTESKSYSGLVLCLYIDEDLPAIAYGAIEFEKSLDPDPSEVTVGNSQSSVKSRLAVLFAIALGDADHLEPRRWTCRDISPSRFERCYESRIRSSYGLELRARTQLAALIDPLSDDLDPMTWERRALLRREGAQTGHGNVFLDDRTWDFSGASFVLRRDDDGHVLGVTSEGGCDPRESVIVAQITFPDEEGRPIAKTPT